jgi:hypothetical protein
VPENKVVSLDEGAKDEEKPFLEQLLQERARKQAGKRFYHVAARETDQTQWKPVLGTLAEKFSLARLALNSLSDSYVKTLRTQYFRSPAES